MPAGVRDFRQLPVWVAMRKPVARIANRRILGCQTTQTDAIGLSLADLTLILLDFRTLSDLAG